MIGEGQGYKMMAELIFLIITFIALTLIGIYMILIITAVMPASMIVFIILGLIATISFYTTLIIRKINERKNI